MIHLWRGLSPERSVHGVYRYGSWKMWRTAIRSLRLGCGRDTTLARFRPSTADEIAPSRGSISSSTD